MTEGILLRFLSHGLIDVGGDDAKLEKLQATASDLAGNLKKTPTKATAYALVAFDPQAPTNDPVVCEVLEALKIRWATYINTFSGTPIAVVRAMLLEALTKAAAEDERIGVAFATSARNTLPFMEAGDERAIWADVVTTIEERVDARAETEWATPSSITAPAMNFDVPELKAPMVKTARTNREQLLSQFRAAGGPQYHDPQQGNVVTNGNPHWQQSNPAQWNAEFSKRMSETIAEVVDTVVGKTMVEQADLSKPFRDLATSVTTYVDATLMAVSGATAGLQRRTNLLWWKEALFSPSIRVSYRQLPPTVAAAQMAFDLHLQIPTFSPASVSAFLFEAVVGLPFVELEETFAIRDLIREAQTNENLAMLRDAGAAMIGPPDGRGPIMALVAHPYAPAADSDTDFRRLTGVPADAQLTLPGWATWVFRELQAARAANDGARPSKRTRKA